MRCSLLWLGGARRQLARQLERLQQTLTSLGQTLRERIAQAVGQSLGGIVRDAVHAALEEIHGGPRYCLPPPDVPRPFHSDGLFSRADRPRGRFPEDRFADEDDFREERLDEAEDRWSEAEPPEPPESPRPVPRWRSLLATVLQTVAWWLRRGFGNPILTAAAISVIGGGLLLGSPLLVSGLGIARSAAEMVSLVHSTSSGAGLLAGWLTP
jgi:hypothetical protein